jgi:hypothetical protein
MFPLLIQRIAQILNLNVAQTNETSTDKRIPGEFWTAMSLSDRRELIAKLRLWDGYDTYYWNYIPSKIRDLIECEYQKNLR